MHLAQAKTLLPDSKVSHWMFGFCRLLPVGLYLVALNRFKRPAMADFFSQIVQCLIVFLYSLFHILHPKLLLPKNQAIRQQL